ncbi:hypothetical protein HELRODRAFT_173338 [Helobdella robusta]|uniref:C-type lectin domain-containing protein n=1 Tax=Helobdella robusta TaxID=6412 RepID=T1F6P6_HELRO|nr:hypothetical protein HELRODRAFT_173338 [Helobdella robusta]ESO03643.1 hypothetical protein HELRODRAFT_173338 [Helobdella robusta]
MYERITFEKIRPKHLAKRLKKNFKINTTIISLEPIYIADSHKNEYNKASSCIGDGCRSSNSDLKRTCSVKCSLNASCAGFAYKRNGERDDCRIIHVDNLRNITATYFGLEKMMVFLRSGDHEKIFGQPLNTQKKMHVFFGNESKWEEARNYCRDEFKASLPSIKNKHENENLRKFLKTSSVNKNCTDYFWTSGKKAASDKSGSNIEWHKVKRLPVSSYRNWENPDEEKSNLTCLAINRELGTWRMSDCSKKLLCYACEFAIDDFAK